MQMRGDLVSCVLYIMADVWYNTAHYTHDIRKNMSHCIKYKPVGDWFARC